MFQADASLGRLLAALDARRPGAIVLLTADHGESFGENHRYLVHGYTTTPNVAHVPFVLAAPGLAPARRREPVSHVDVMPTLLELAGLPVPKGARGTALGPVLRGEAELPDRWVYCDVGRELTAYKGDHFFRLLGVDGAWLEGEDLRPVWVRHAWPRKTWHRAPGEDPDPRILEHAERAVPMHRIDLDPQSIELLRALGYSGE